MVESSKIISNSLTLTQECSVQLFPKLRMKFDAKIHICKKQ